MALPVFFSQTKIHFPHPHKSSRVFSAFVFWIDIKKKQNIWWYLTLCFPSAVFFAGNQRFTNPSSCSNFLFDVRTTIVPIATKIGNPLGLTAYPYTTCTCHWNIFVLNTSNLGNYSKYWFTNSDSPFFWLVRKTSHFFLMWEDFFPKPWWSRHSPPTDHVRATGELVGFVSF